MITATLQEGAWLVTAADPVVDTPMNTAQVLSLFIGFVLPVVVGLVTTRVTHPAVKAILLLFLSAVSGFLTEWMNSPGDNFVFSQALLTWLMTFVVGVASHYGLWKPTGTTELAQNTLVTPRTAQPPTAHRSP